MKDQFNDGAGIPSFDPPFAAGHAFANLKAHLAGVADRPLLIGNEEANLDISQAFLLSPFFNVTLLGPTRKVIFQDVDTVRMRTDKNRAAIYDDFTKSVIEGSRAGIFIKPVPFPDQEVDEAVAALSAESTRRVENLGGDKLKPEVRDLYKTIFGRDFTFGSEQDFGEIMRSTVRWDILAALYRKIDRETAENLIADSDDTSWAAIIASTQMQGALVTHLRTLTGQAPALLDISIDGNLRNTVLKTIASDFACPLYHVREDKIIEPASLGLDPKDCARFRQGLHALAESRFNIAPHTGPDFKPS